MNNTKNNVPSGLPVTTVAIEKDGNTQNLKEVFRTLKEEGYGDAHVKVSVIVIELNPK